MDIMEFILMTLRFYAYSLWVGITLLTKELILLWKPLYFIEDDDIERKDWKSSWFSKKICFDEKI